MKVDYASSRWERLKQLFYWSVGIVVTLLTLLLSRDRIELAFSQDGMATAPLPQLSFVLLVTTVLLILMWMQAVFTEMQMLRDYCFELIPPVPQQSFLLMFAIPGFLALLAYFSNRTLIYSSILVFFKLLEVWGIWIRNLKILQGLTQGRNSTPLTDGRRQKWDVIERYYIERPQTQLAITEMFLCFVAIILSLYGELLSEFPLKLWLSSAAYGIVLLAIALNLVVYTIWRWKRDRLLGEPYR